MSDKPLDESGQFKADGDYHTDCYEAYLEQCGIAAETILYDSIKELSKYMLSRELPRGAAAYGYDTEHLMMFPETSSESEYSNADREFDYFAEDESNLLDMGVVDFANQHNEDVVHETEEDETAEQYAHNKSGLPSAEFETLELDPNQRYFGYNKNDILTAVIHGHDPDQYYWLEDIPPSEELLVDRFNQRYTFKLEPIYRILENCDFRLNCTYVREHKLYQNAIIGGSNFDIPNTIVDHELPLNANETFKRFENPSEMFNRRSQANKKESEKQGEEEKEKENPVGSFILLSRLTPGTFKQPADDLENPLHIAPHPLQLDMRDRDLNSRASIYKNNLIAVSRKYSFLVVGVLNTLKFEFLVNLKRVAHYPQSNDDPRFRLKKFALSMNFASLLQQEDGRIPLINYIKIGYFFNQETLAVGCDGGQVFLYYTKDLLDVLKSCSLQPDGNFDRSDLWKRYAVKVQLKSSVWGIDFFEDTLVVSDNSHMVTLFHFTDKSKLSLYYKCVSEELLHNIPCVSLLKEPKHFDTQCYPPLKPQIRYVAATTIYGEVLIIRFALKMEKNDNTELPPRPYVESRCLVEDPGWTVEFVNLKRFTKVSNFKELTGDQFLDQQNLIPKKILNNSKALDIEADPCYSSHMGFAAYLQEFNIPTIPRDDWKRLRSSDVFSTTEKYKRNRKFFDDYYVYRQQNKSKSWKSVSGKLYWEPVPEVDLNDWLLFMTSSSKMHLFRPKRLVLNASTPEELFDYIATGGEYSDLHHMNRMSISIHIPELNCMVVATQAGVVTVMRLTKHRGCVGFRQEYIIPGDVTKTFVPTNFSGQDGILGLSYSVIPESYNSKVSLYIMTTDLKLWIYELSLDVTRNFEIIAKSSAIF